MLKTTFQILLILGIGLVTVGTTCCRKELLQGKPVYEFAGKFSVTPYKKNYNVNDTIWLSYETADKNLLDTITNTIINADTTFFVYQIEYEKRYPASTNAIDTFYYTKASGITNEYHIYKSGFNFFDFYTECNNSGGYSVKIGIIPKTVGIYSINFNYGAGFNKCPNKIIPFPSAGLRFEFNLADCNKDIYLSIPATARENSQETETLIDKKKILVFKVL